MDDATATDLATEIRHRLELEDNTAGNTARQAIISALKLLPNPDGGLAPLIRRVPNAASETDRTWRVELFYRAKAQLYSVTARRVEVYTASADVTTTRLADISSVQREQAAMTAPGEPVPPGQAPERVHYPTRWVFLARGHVVFKLKGKVYVGEVGDKEEVDQEERFARGLAPDFGFV